MIGAFLIVIAVLMLVQSGAVMFDSWQAVRDFDTCIEKAGYNSNNLSNSVGLDYILFELKANECKDSFFAITGAQVPGGVYTLTQRQMWTAILGPITNFFVWAIVLLFALFLFNNASFVLPVEMVELPVRPFEKKKK
jgi:hypothetical protein